MVGLLSRTKTSGPVKQTKVLPIFVSQEAYIQAEWLDVGLSLWKEELGFPMDFLLVLPNEDLSGCIRKRARYSDAQNFSKSLLTAIVAESGEKLLLPETASFWTEHSDRAGMDSWLGALGVGPEHRCFLGRWAIQGSQDTYIRTALRIVENLQRLAARHARAVWKGGADHFGEE